MEYVKKSEIEIDALAGRGLLRVIGKQSHFDSDKMSVGYAIYSQVYGLMEPHAHAEETVIITSVKEGSFSWGKTKDDLYNSIKLEEGMILHIPQDEWHVFNYERDGFIEIIFIYGETSNLRADDNN